MIRAAKELITAEQLPQSAEGRRLELVRGEVVAMSPVKRRHGRVVVRLASQLLDFVRRHRLGEVHTEVGFILARGPDTVRAPDISFVSAERLAQAEADSFIEGAPDLAVEVLSPDDRASEVMVKVGEYLRSGARQVWIVDPHSETLTVYRASGDARIHEARDAVTGDDVLPGFSFVPADLFAAS